MQAVVNKIWRHAHFLTPSGDMLNFTIDGHKMSVPPKPPIIVLLSLGSPTAVIRRIALVVIHSLNCQSVRAFTHVGEEIFKRLKPAFTNDNPAASVV
jgi:hypothetical protein